MIKWEYKKISIGYSMCEDKLNEMGEEGWEFCWCDKYNAYFKRPKVPQA